MTFQWRSNKAISMTHDSIGKANALQYAPAYNARATRLYARINSYIYRHDLAICVDEWADSVDVNNKREDK